MMRARQLVAGSVTILALLFGTDAAAYAKSSDKADKISKDVEREIKKRLKKLDKKICKATGERCQSEEPPPPPPPPDGEDPTPFET